MRTGFVWSGQRSAVDPKEVSTSSERKVKALASGFGTWDYVTQGDDFASKGNALGKCAKRWWYSAVSRFLLLQRAKGELNELCVHRPGLVQPMLSLG